MNINKPGILLKGPLGNITVSLNISNSTVSTIKNINIIEP